MLTRRRDPFATLGDLRVDFARLFGGVFRDAPWTNDQPAAFPALNAWETDEALTVEAELPGFSLEQIDITLLGRDLTIKGTHEEQEPEDARLHRRERPRGSFSRTLRLPYEVDGDAIEARLTDGVLTITLPRAPELRPRKIEVRSA